MPFRSSLKCIIPQTIDNIYWYILSMLKPLKRPVGDVWYSKSAIVHNILGKTIQCLMKAANIPGTLSNHSLRSTVTTRLFNARVDEQLIMSRTGHSSTAGVRAYDVPVSSY